MPKPNPKPPEATIWEQWLSRLTNTATPVMDLERNRLELFGFLAQNPPINEQFNTRFGTFLSRCLRDSLVCVVKLGKTPTILFSNAPVSQTRTVLEKINNHLLAERSGQQVSHFRFRAVEFQRPGFPPKLDTVTVIDLALQSNFRVKALVVGRGNLSEYDRRFVDVIGEQITAKRGYHSVVDSLVEETERLSILTHHLSEGLMILDDKLDVQTWNRPMQRLTGYPQREAEGKNYAKYLQRLGAERWLDDVLAQYAKDPAKNVFYADFQISTKQREKRWVSVSGSFLRNKLGNIYQTVMIVRDISRLKDLENRKNEFISIATHELRTPITAIKGYLSMLEKTARDLSEKQQHYLQRAIDANNRLANLAEELLQVAQIEDNRITFSSKTVNSLPIVRKVVSDLQEKASKKGLNLGITIPEFSVTIIVDPIRFEQVIANLVDNAIKYTNSGRVQIEFAQNQTGFLTINISDTGIGLSEQEIGHIFEKFHRTRLAQSGREPGTGLGLFIVKSFIEKQGGKITVKSRPNRGSTFSVNFPTGESKLRKEKP